MGTPSNVTVLVEGTAYDCLKEGLAEAIRVLLGTDEIKTEVFIGRLSAMVDGAIQDKHTAMVLTDPTSMFDKHLAEFVGKADEAKILVLHFAIKVKFGGPTITFYRLTFQNAGEDNARILVSREIETD